MKKLAICVFIAVMTFGLAITASAKEVFEVTLVPTGTQTEGTGKLEVSERGEVKVEIEGATADQTLSVFFVPFGEGEKCQVGTVTVNADGEVDTEFDAAWVVNCELQDPIVGLFQVENDTGALFITGFSLDQSKLAIDPPELPDPPEEEEDVD